MRKKIYYIGFLLVLTTTILFSLSGSKTSGEVKGEKKSKNSTFAGRILSALGFGKTGGKIRYSLPEFVQWFENDENEMIQTKTIGAIQFIAFYTPVKYKAAKELQVNHTDSVSYKLKLKEAGDMEYFTFRIKCLTDNTELLKFGITNEGEYYQRLEYFSFKMQDDFKMVEGSDTLSCSLFHYERVYGLSPHATFLIGFPKRKGLKDISLIYNDKVFNKGNIILSIKQEIIDTSPELKF